MLHAGDAYFDPRDVRGPRRQCAGLFQAFAITNRAGRFRNQTRLRNLTATHPEVHVFCAHNPWGLEAAQEADSRLTSHANSFTTAKRAAHRVC